jgi:hypothetical protein
MPATRPTDSIRRLTAKLGFRSGQASALDSSLPDPAAAVANTTVITPAPPETPVLALIDLGKPSQNGAEELFNGTFP